MSQTLQRVMAAMSLLHVMRDLLFKKTAMRGMPLWLCGSIAGVLSGTRIAAWLAIGASRPLTQGLRWSTQSVRTSQAMREAADRQARLIAEVEERRRVRATVVPTAVPEVKALLRELGEPTTLFGEGPVRTPTRLCRCRNPPPPMFCSALITTASVTLTWASVPALWLKAGSNVKTDVASMGDRHWRHCAHRKQ